jgi:hypothetical protein
MKKAKDMNPAERQAGLESIKRAAEKHKFEPMPPLDKSASEKERERWLREYVRRTR